jgi:hypothetical protein
LRLTVSLASVMLVLTVVIILDAVRRWFGILTQPHTPGVTETV